MLVPYDGVAGRLIERLSEPELSPREIAGLMRRAQRYAVSLYEPTRRSLERRGALRLLPCGAYALEKAFYDEETGVHEEGKWDFLEG